MQTHGAARTSVVTIFEVRIAKHEAEYQTATSGMSSAALPAAAAVAVAAALLELPLGLAGEREARLLRV